MSEIWAINLWFRKSVIFFPPSQFDSKTSFAVFTVYSNAGEKRFKQTNNRSSSHCGCMEVPMGACLICTSTYSQLNALNVKKFIPLTSHLINTRLPPIVWLMMNLKALVTSVFKKTDVTKILSNLTMPNNLKVPSNLKMPSNLTVLSNLTVPSNLTSA